MVYYGTQQTRLSEAQMDSSVIYFFVVVPIVIGVVLYVLNFAGNQDHDRVKEYVGQRGERLLSAEWAPFGPGAVADENERIYQVRYLDRDGNEHEAYAKTSMWTGVTFTQDRIVHYAQTKNDTDEVESFGSDAIQE